MKEKIIRTDELVESIVNMYADGLSQRQIAKKINSGTTFVAQVLREKGVQPRGKAFYAKKFSDDIENIIISEYENGMTIMQLADKYNCTNTVIITIFKRRGLSFRETRDYTIKYHIDEHYFDSIDSQDKAYILGFFYADGWNISNKNECNYCCGMTLKENDEYILREMSEKMHSEYPITKIVRGDRVYSKMCITNKYIALSLEKIGIVPAKTFKTEFPNWLREDLIPHFIRGLLDGDGCIRNDLRSLSIAGTYRLMNGVKEILDEVLDYDCKIYPHSKSENICYLHIHPLDKKN